jgi:excinuclease ABC subunit A
VHNLRDLNIDLPRDQLIVLTGVSGSGKSSLAFDTIYAEGQRQFIETLSSYARQFLDQLQRPDVDLIEGLQPVLCIDQEAAQRNPRSTVATITELYDYLRLLYARVGKAVCYRCGLPVEQQTPAAIEAAVRDTGMGTKLMLLAPLVRGRRGVHEEVFIEIRRAGLLRARVDGVLYELDAVPPLAPRKNHTIEAVVDRVIVRPEIETRIADSIRLTLRMSGGLLLAMTQVQGDSAWNERLFSTTLACPGCGVSYAELEPRTFSFNSPYGACSTCAGMGKVESFSHDLVFPEAGRSLAENAAAPFRSSSASLRQKLRRAVEEQSNGAEVFDVPLEKLTPTQRKKVQAAVLELLEKEWSTTHSEERKRFLSSFREQVICLDCHGDRLRPEALSVRIGGQNIAEFGRLSVEQAQRICQAWKWDEGQAEIARQPLREIKQRLQFLEAVGVGYLSLDRSADSLSGGELQRVRLATCIGSGLVGCCYILDEPSVGLHPADNDRLIAALRALQAQGNTVLVVEHDEAMMRVADHLVDLGPGAGRLGGTIVAQGHPQAVANDCQSLTGQYLSGQRSIRLPERRRDVALRDALQLKGATLHNLKNVSVRVPLGTLVGVSGVSGSGKSSLIIDTLAPAIARGLGLAGARPGPYEQLRNARKIERLLLVDQASIGRSPRSCPATFTGAWDDIRKVFASTRDAKQRGYSASRFSFNAADGRCAQCAGQGVERIEMNFLSDLFITCTACNGQRFNHATLEVRYKGVTIADVLRMSIDQAADFFANFNKIAQLMDGLRNVGLGYLQLGQPTSSLSGGEAQRLKLAAELALGQPAKTLYVLDEPTTGLHLEDVRQLVEVLHALVDCGHTVIVIEHHMDVIKNCDWVLDLGPTGGETGGQLLFEGRPEELVKLTASPTALPLQRAMQMERGVSASA